MNSNVSWSLSLGRWVGVPVRVHALLVLFIAFIFSVEYMSPSGSLLVSAVATSFVLLVSIVIHELAHVFAVHNIGGNVKELTFMPWGGNSNFDLPPQKTLRIMAYLSGPFVNFSIFLFGAALLVQTNQGNLVDFIHPFRPNRFEAGNPRSLIEIITWVNFQLLIANCIPVYPFDFAQIVRNLFMAVNRDLPQQRVEAAVRVIGTAIAFAFIGLAWLLRGHQVGPVEPLWFLLFSAGVVLYFSARFSYVCEVNRERENVWTEPVPAPSSLAESWSDSSFFVFGDSEDPEYSRWLIEKQESRIRDDMELEQREKELADKVLEKLHREGSDSLSSDEKLLLQRVSERLRRKRKLDVID